LQGAHFSYVAVTVHLDIANDAEREPGDAAIMRDFRIAF